jgi:hypothetical protein
MLPTLHQHVNTSDQVLTENTSNRHKVQVHHKLYIMALCMSQQELMMLTLNLSEKIAMREVCSSCNNKNGWRKLAFFKTARINPHPIK